jgi:hypothetical protein
LASRCHSPFLQMTTARPFTCAEARASVLGSKADQARHEHQPKICAKNGCDVRRA